VKGVNANNKHHVNNVVQQKQIYEMWRVWKWTVLSLGAMAP